MFSTITNMLPNLSLQADKDSPTPMGNTINPFDKFMAVKRKLEGARTSHMVDVEPEPEEEQDDKRETERKERRKQKPLNEVSVYKHMRMIAHFTRRLSLFGPLRVSQTTHSTCSYSLFHPRFNKQTTCLARRPHPLQRLLHPQAENEATPQLEECPMSPLSAQVSKARKKRSGNRLPIPKQTTSCSIGVQIGMSFRNTLSSPLTLGQIRPLVILLVYGLIRLGYLLFDRRVHKYVRWHTQNYSPLQPQRSQCITEHRPGRG
jgi:hypothetical protein